MLIYLYAILVVVMEENKLQVKEIVALVKEKGVQVISVLNQKGGTGKTTVTLNIAKCLQIIGFKVLVIDSDPQGSLRDWNEANEKTILPIIGMDRETLVTDLKAVKDGYDIIVIDGAPRVEKLMGAAIKVSNLVVIPVQPSPFDISASADLVCVIQDRQEITNGKPKAVFLPSSSKGNLVTTKEIKEDLKDYGFKVLDQNTSNLLVYLDTPRYGETVFCEYKELLQYAQKEHLLRKRERVRGISYDSLSKARKEIANITKLILLELC
jgi:chromosome partitioning protein